MINIPFLSQIKLGLIKVSVIVSTSLEFCNQDHLFNYTTNNFMLWEGQISLFGGSSDMGAKRLVRAELRQLVG